MEPLSPGTVKAYTDGTVLEPRLQPPHAEPHTMTIFEAYCRDSEASSDNM